MTGTNADYARIDETAGPRGAGAPRHRVWLKDGALQNAILDSASYLIIATDETGVIQLFNAGAERMLGYRAAEMVDLLTPTHFSEPLEVVARAVLLSREQDTPIAPGFEALVFRAARGIEDIYEQTCVRKDGSRFSAMVSVTSLKDESGNIIGFLLIGTDNSAREQVEQQLRETRLQQAETERGQARLEADKAVMAQFDYLSAMGHELRNPLNAILGFAQLMASDSPAPTPAQKDGIARILQAGWYQMELIDEVLDLATIESGHLGWSIEPVSLPDVMRECQVLVEPHAQKRGVRIDLRNFDHPCLVMGDRARVKQVLVKLLANAIKYNQPGGSVVVQNVAVDSPFARVSVRDTGAGLAPEQLARLFQPFHRPGQESGAEQGSGIGLAVTKRLVELMGGAIGVQSSIGEGSAFWIELPAAAAPPAALDLAAPTVAAADEPLVQPPRRTVLYVEDNPANLELVEQIIARRPGIRLLTARNGLLGVELARSALPDLILMDINLPGMGGIEALQLLRADPLTVSIPVVAVSANAMPRDIAGGMQAGFLRYLTKPIRVNEFLQTLDLALESAPSR